MSERVTFFQMLNLELQAMAPEDYFEPIQEITPHDNQVGTMSDYLMRLYSLQMSTQKLAAEKKMQINFGRLQDNQRKDLEAKFNELSEKVDLLHRLFWVELKEEHKLWDKPAAGVRKGWIIVWYTPPPTQIIGFPFGNI